MIQLSQLTHKRHLTKFNIHSHKNSQKSKNGGNFLNLIKGIY